MVVPVNGARRVVVYESAFDRKRQEREMQMTV